MRKHKRVSADTIALVNYGRLTHYHIDIWEVAKYVTAKNITAWYTHTDCYLRAVQHPKYRKPAIPKTTPRRDKGSCKQRVRIMATRSIHRTPRRKIHSREISFSRKKLMFIIDYTSNGTRKVKSCLTIAALNRDLLYMSNHPMFVVHSTYWAQTK